MTVAEATPDSSVRAAPYQGAGKTDLVRRAAAGDQKGWEGLVERYTGVLWSIARAFRLGQADSADVVQSCWLMLAGNLDRIRDPEAVSGWLATTARHECLRLLRTRRRERPSNLLEEFDQPNRYPSLEHQVADRDRDRRLLAALRRLPARDQQLLRVLAASPPPSYQQVAAALGMPIGSIGPTRARCLARLRRELAVVGLDKQAALT